MESNILHLDSYTGPQWMTTSFKETPDGALEGRAIVTSTGIFSYFKKDGTISRELRLPEEVFAEPFLESLKGMPITLDHRPAVVTKETAPQFAVGRAGDDPSNPKDGNTDNYHVAITLRVDRKDGVDAVKKGKQALSVGYRCDFDPTPGVWCGQPYDGIQRNLRANHVSLVSRGRQGDAAKIRLDSEDEDLRIYLDSLSSQEDKTTLEVDKMADDKMKSVKLDGAEYQAEPEVLKALHAATVRADGLDAELGEQKVKLDAAIAESTKLSAERDAAKERADKAEAALEDLKKSTISRADAMAQAKVRLDMEAFAGELGIKVDAQDDLTLMKEILTKKEVKLDGKDEIYVKVRYDILREEKRNDAADDAAARLANGDKKDEKLDAADPKAKRLAMIERMQNAYKGGK